MERNHRAGYLRPARALAEMPGADTLPLYRNQKGLTPVWDLSHAFSYSAPVVGWDPQGQEVSAPLLQEEHSLATISFCCACTVGLFQGGRWGPSNTDDIKTHLPHASGHSADWSFSNKATEKHHESFPAQISLHQSAWCRLSHISFFLILWWGSRR